MKYLLLLLAACGRYGFADLADASGSGSTGTRLKQEYNVYDGTLRQPANLYDTVLGAECFVESTTTAGLRCLPAGGKVSYLDTACTHAIGAKDNVTTPYLFDSYQPPMAHAYTFGASIGVPAMIYARQLDGSCAATTTTSEQFEVTEVSFDTFARLTPRLGREGRLVSQTLVADDGFTTPGALHDTQVDADCFGSVFDDVSACVVYPTDITYTYTDSACTQPAEDAYVPVQFAEHWGNYPPCRSTDIDVHPLTTTLPSSTPIWIKLPGDVSCVATAVPASYQLYALGAAFSLAPVTRAPVPGGRMQLIASTANGARGTDPQNVWDSTLGIECRPTMAYDGVQRCMPQVPYAQHAGYFTDAGCTVPIVGAGVVAPVCSSYPVAYLLDLEGSGNAAHVFQAMARSGAIYGGGPTNCQPYAQTAFYSEGAEIPIAMFAAVTQQTDP